MRLRTTTGFERRAKKLSDRQGVMLRAALRRFVVDPQDPLLRTRKLKGELADYWAFSVDRGVRVLFRWEGDTAVLVSVGSHDEVY